MGEQVGRQLSRPCQQWGTEEAPETAGASLVLDTHLVSDGRLLWVHSIMESGVHDFMGPGKGNDTLSLVWYV